MNNKYESPLSSRYASTYMLELFSADKRYQTWRRLWISLAKAEKSLGLPITEEQIEEMEAHIKDEHGEDSEIWKIFDENTSIAYDSCPEYAFTYHLRN